MFPLVLFVTLSGVSLYIVALNVVSGFPVKLSFAVMLKFDVAGGTTVSLYVMTKSKSVDGPGTTGVHPPPSTLSVAFPGAYVPVAL